MINGIEVRRKLVHLATLIIPIGYAISSRETILFVLLFLFFGLLSVDLLRHFHKGVASLFKKYLFGKILRDKEKPNLMGSTYFLLSTILTILIFPKSIAIVSILILILSDTLAALVGRGIGKVKIFNKTLEGTVAFLLSAVSIVWLYPDIDRFSGTLAALAATMIEMLPIPFDDNLTIPLIAGTIMFFAKV